MKKLENSFAVTGFIGKDAEIRSFQTASVARFSIAISRAEKEGEETTYVSSFMGVEAWRKNEALDSFDVLKKRKTNPDAVQKEKRPKPLHLFGRFFLLGCCLLGSRLLLFFFRGEVELGGYHDYAAALGSGFGICPFFRL